MNTNNYLQPDVFYLLCLLKVKYNVVYNGIRAKAYKVQEFINAIESTVFKEYVKNTTSSLNDWSLEYTMAVLLTNYNKPYYEDVVDKGFVGENTENKNQKIYPYIFT